MCTEAIARILVFVANFAFFLVGTALLSVGILYVVQYTNLTDVIPSDYAFAQYIPIIAIVVGAIIFFIAFLGCWGTCTSNTCMLTTYASILLVIFLIQVALGVFGLITIKNQDDLTQKVDQAVTELFNQYRPSTDIAGVVDLVQQNLRCCGNYGPMFWTIAIPASCYETPNEVSSIFPAGCTEKMTDFLNDSIRLIAIIALSISAVEIIGAILALYLSNVIKGTQRRAGYY